MTDMVNTAIMIADIESGQLTTERQPVDLELVLSTAMAACTIRNPGMPL
jgi:hypothetical protein